MKIGDILIAVDECKMDGTERRTLTIGRKYEITYANEEEFIIYDDEEKEHYFDIIDYKDFFRLESEYKKPDTIVESVINQFKKRSEVGIKKYGVTLDREYLSAADWILHTQQELMDGILYLEKLKQTL